MKGILMFLWAWFVAAASVAAQDAKARASLETKGEIWAGQSVTVVLELLAPGYFASAASFHFPDPPGMLLIPPTGSPVVSSETDGDINYTVQRFEITVLASRGGPQTVPPLGVSFQFKRHPLDKDSVAATVTTEPIGFVTKVPPGAEALGFVISARDLSAVEQWQPELGRTKAGAAFTRTITYFAPDVPAMAFPPFRTGSIDGLGIYPKPPEVISENERGVLTGKRRDTISYVCKRPGKFIIPAARITWFDLDAKELKTIDFPERTLDVAPNPAMAGTAAETLGQAWERTPLLVLLGTLVVGGVALLVWKTRGRWMPVFSPFRPVRLAPLNPTVDGR